ncbi:MAG TPA: hypothetical protein VFC65_10410 [Prolixibacteraceae bacterium]|nr:hypothetical protein [Prolixibacteraceae bacterium]
MRKFAANYLVSETGIFLKNGIVIVEEDGTIVQFLDTKGDLREIAQLSFHNGILMTGCIFVRTNDLLAVAETKDSIRHFVFKLTTGINQISIQTLVEWCKQIQEQFPTMKAPEILNEIAEFLQSSGGFTKEYIPGIFLLIGVDLVHLRFTPKSRLKKIF